MTKHILCAIDLNHTDTEASLLKEAAALARFHNASLSVITVVPDYGMSVVGSFFPEGTMRAATKEANRRLHEYVDSVLPGHEHIQHIVEVGNVYERILDVVRRTDDIDLIVVGAHKPNLAERLQGPNSARIARYAPCSVLVMRAR